MRFRATGDPSDVDHGRLSLQAIRDELERIVADRRTDDRRTHLLDGLALYGPADAERWPLPDRLHPDTATHRVIGERFAARAFGAGNPLGSGRDVEPSPHR